MKLMKQINKRLSILAMLLVLFANLCAFADKTPVENLYQYNLDNGLTLFVAENHSVPLAYIEIAVRAGGTTQTPETAGLFHLYEHMMFKGNALYPNAASVQRALSDMGVASWNGTTGTDHVNYFFTIPSSELENGLAFWNAAIRSPNMDAAELENEKPVVLSEIEGDASDPSYIYYYYQNCKMFPDAPYRNDPAGSIQVVTTATVDQLHDMQNKYYIPANAALFVGGDVNPAEVYKMVNEIYGSWSNNGNSRPGNGPQQNVAPFADVQYAVMPYDQMAPQITQVTISWRGPDVDFAEEDTYAADYLGSLLADPAGKFKTALVNDEDLGIPASDYVSGGYGTVRANGTYDFRAVMLSPEVNLIERTDKLLDQIQNNIIPSIVNDPASFNKAKIKEMGEQRKMDTIRSSETASGLLSNLRFWWTCCSPEYYYSYDSRMSKVSQKNLQNFSRKYFEGKKPLVTVLVNPSVYEMYKDAFAAKGYEVISADNAFWYNNPKFAIDSSKIAKNVAFTPDANIYVPVGKKTSASSSASSAIKEFKLANGIPVYVKSDKSKKIATLSLGFKGGVQRLDPTTSGLSSALLKMMSTGSAKYDRDTRDVLSYLYNSSIYSSSYMSGDSLTLNAIASNFNKMLPVFVDGVLNPSYAEDDYTNLMNDYAQSVQQTLNDPASLLSYTAMKELYKDHPYLTRSGVTPDSIDNITVENMKALHERMLNADDMFLVAAGNVDGKKLVKELNKTLGKIAANGAFNVKDVPDLSVSGAPVLLSSPAVENSGYVLRAFASPSNDSPDYIPSALAGKIYSEIMFNVVRERNGVCYTPISNVGGSRGAYGYEYLYSLKKYDKFASVMDEARKVLASGKVISAVADDGSYIYAPVSDSLTSFKNKFINSNYESQATLASATTEYVYNVLQFNDINHDAAQLEAVNSTTADDVVRCFNKYWIDQSGRWFIIVGTGNVKSVNLNDPLLKR